MTIYQLVDTLLFKIFYESIIAKILQKSTQALSIEDKRNYVENAKEFVYNALTNIALEHPSFASTLSKEYLTEEEIMEISFMVGILVAIFDLLHDDPSTGIEKFSKRIQLQ